LTDHELQGLAAQALNLAKRDMERGQFNFLVASYHRGEPLHRMNRIEALIIERLGEEWLNAGRTKDIGFRILRMATEILPPDALVIVTAANRFKATDKMLALPEAQQLEILESNHDRHHRAVAEGLLTVCDCLHATAQSATRVCVYFQDYLPGGEFDGPPETRFRAQEDFGGRLKMYGNGVFQGRA